MTAGSDDQEGAGVDTHLAELAAGAGGNQADVSRRAIARALPANPRRGDQLAPSGVRGRPKGATNKRDTEIAEAYISQYGDPLEADVKIGSAAPGELVTELRVIASDRGIKLGMTLGEILRWQADCRSRAMNYLHAKRAAVNEKGETVAPIIGMGTLPPAAGDGSGHSIEDAIEGEIIQGDSTSGSDVSHDGKSHDAE
jgi:hypothetical protein